jgi:hypothetical protein
MKFLKFSELPPSIQAIFPEADKKYGDFKAYVKVVKGTERYFVYFNGTTTRFVWEGKCWHADKTW